eukprot:scaffold462_cov195-Pinguiococcus_pyrenoidosus.AAC.85
MICAQMPAHCYVRLRVAVLVQASTVRKGYRLIAALDVPDAHERIADGAKVALIGTDGQRVDLWAPEASSLGRDLSSLSMETRSNASPETRRTSECVRCSVEWRPRSTLCGHSPR